MAEVTALEGSGSGSGMVEFDDGGGRMMFGKRGGWEIRRCMYICTAVRSFGSGV